MQDAASSGGRHVPPAALAGPATKAARAVAVLDPAGVIDDRPRSDRVQLAARLAT
jgi:hypothetical protein